VRIIGGIYNERTIFPEDDVIYGSGGRAAAALSQLDSDIKLTSYVGENRRTDIEYHIKNIWKVELEPYYIPEIVSFSYYHGLSTPVIKPTQLPIPNLPTIEVKDNVILQFGMLEGQVIVKGNKVVYDPQNPENPDFFDKNGSTAQDLAYVLNRNEAFMLSQKCDSDEAAAIILSKHNASVVIIKSGAYGAKIYTRTTTEHVGAYMTQKVWSVGSGDIFSAVFAYFWGMKNSTPLEAAQYASKGAALYCETRQLPICEDAFSEKKFKLKFLLPLKKPTEANIYLAGPFFTMGQLWLIEEARTALMNAGFNVFSPYHDVGLGDADEVVPADIQGIEDADVMLALCDGLDAGTLFEVGYAVKKGLPIVAFGEQTSSESMKMLYGTNCKVFKDFASAIYHAQWEAIT